MKSIKKIWVPFAGIVLMGTLFLSTMTTAWAAKANPADAKSLVENITKQVLQKLKADPSQVYTLVDKVVLPHFDFEKMSQLVLGRNWRKASKDQRSRFVQEFRGLLVRTYANALVEAAKTKVDVTYEDPISAGIKRCPDCIILKTEVKQSGQPPIQADYAMYMDNKGNWKAYNVMVGGVSLVTNYRTEFNKKIKDPKIGIDGLIEEIKNKNRD